MLGLQGLVAQGRGPFPRGQGAQATGARRVGQGTLLSLIKPEGVRIDGISSENCDLKLDLELKKFIPLRCPAKIWATLTPRPRKLEWRVKRVKKAGSGCVW